MNNVYISNLGYRIEVAKDPGRWGRWRIYTNNFHLLAHPDETYATKGAAMRVARKHYPPKAIPDEAVLVTRANVETVCRYGATLYHATERQANGREAYRARVSGKVRTWKRDPDRFSVPWKHGMYTTGHFTQRELGDWYACP